MLHTLPAQDFFKPNTAFAQWLEQAEIAKNDHIIEVGAGRGLLTKFIGDAGYKITGFDIHLRVISKLGGEPVLLIARPCHDGFAFDYYVFWLIACGYRRAYYIGLESNLETDLNGLSYTQVASNVGESGENIYLVGADHASD